MSRIRENETSPDRDPLDLLAEDFARRCRDGENPSVEEYAARYPELAEAIRLLLPTVAFLERGKQAGGSPAMGLGSGEMAALNGLSFRQLGENQVVRELGRGGMGIVYEAVQEPLGRRVAVKVLPRHAHANATSRQRFLREARLVARLQHPNIVPIYSVGEHDGIPYYVMAFIDGPGLDRLLADPKSSRPDDPRERARWVANLGRQAAEALAHAHGQHILHRDIKPANLLLDAAGTLWLADFGLAKLADDLSLTATGDLPGTLRYLAPECLTAEADERSDLYSLGLTLYELLVGRPAFLEMDRVRLLRQIESQGIPPPRTLDRGVPRDLETIILKATAREPSGRYPTATALADDLGRFLDGRPIHGRRASAAERLYRWGRRNRLVVLLGGTSILLGMIAALFVAFYLMAPPRPPGAPWFPFPGAGRRPHPRPPEFDPWRPEFGPPPRPGPPPGLPPAEHVHPG